VAFTTRYAIDPRPKGETTLLFACRVVERLRGDGHAWGIPLECSLGSRRETLLGNARTEVQSDVHLDLLGML
jgi:hypothetical protein